jgi:hypothetical protein
MAQSGNRVLKMMEARLENSSLEFTVFDRLRLNVGDDELRLDSKVPILPDSLTRHRQQILAYVYAGNLVA